MTDGNFISLSWNDQLKVFHDNLESVRRKPAKRPVHDLRVAIKKMRSYLRLLERIKKTEWESQFIPIKNLFKISGRQRDFEMSISLLSKSEKEWNLSLPYFKKFLQNNKSLARKFTKKIAIEFDLTILISITNTTFSSATLLTNTELINTIKVAGTEALKNVSQLSEDLKKNAHEIRKQLKDFYYWLLICPDNSVSNPIEINVLDRILRDLGDWQDNFMFSKKLKHFKRELLVKNSDQVKEIEMLEEKISNKGNELIGKVENSIRVFYKK